MIIFNQVKTVQSINNVSFKLINFKNLNMYENNYYIRQSYHKNFFFFFWRAKTSYKVVRILLFLYRACKHSIKYY